MNKSMKRYISIIAFAFAVTGWAQTQPIITGIDKKIGTANEIVTISGSGFVATPVVYFGTGQSTNVTFISANQLQAEVPASATSGPITVINQNGPPRLSATSSAHFSIAFDKDDAGLSFSPPALGTGITMGDFTYDLCLCNLDGDANNLLDVVVTNDDDTNLNILRNTSTVSSTSFVTTTFDNEGDNSHNADCADLNGDGLPDLVVTTNNAGGAIHIYQNNSTPGSISLASAQTKIVLPAATSGQRSPKRVRLFDVDGDGLKDIVVGVFTDGDRSFFVFLNTSGANVLFDPTPIEIVVDANIENTGALYPGDFDNDNRIDVVVIPTGATDQLHIMKNKSVPGTVSFELATSFGNQRQRNNVVAGDFNNDGFIDIATDNPTNSSVSVFENNGSLSFAETSYSATGSNGWGLDVGDLNGDGLTDIVMTSLSSQIVYFENTSTTSVSFANGVIRSTTGPVRNVKVGDLNNDGKPDIGFTDNSVATGVGQFNTITNNLCMTPVIAPASGVFCNGSEFILRATGGENVTYTWDVSHGGAAPTISETDNEIDLNAYGPFTGSISVTVNAAVAGSTSCNIGADSDPVGFSIGSAAQAQPTINDPGIVCLGDNFTLTSSTTGLANYYWSGPNGFSETTNIASVEVSASAEYINSGTYTLIVDDGDCQSPEQTIDIVISGPPVTTIESSNCDNGTITLEVPDFSSQFTYQWKRDGGNVGTDSPSHTDSQAGTYTLDITDGDGCTYTTDDFEIYTSSYTGPSFGAVNEVCIDVETTFDADQTGSGIDNVWEVEDPSSNVTSFSGDQLVTTFTTAGSWEVRLYSTYSSPNTVGLGCTSKTITVSNLPSYAIESNSVDNTGPVTKCPSDNLTLSFSEVGSGDILTVTWDSLGTDVVANTLLVNEPGTYNATYTTNTGCEETVSLQINNFPDLGLTATDPDGVFTPSIVDGEVELGNGQLSLTLSVDASVTGTVWGVVDGSGEATIEASGNSVLITPETPSVIIEVTGTTSDACTETEQILVIGGTFLARKSFSPNGDGTNDFWGIVNASVLEACSVYILDQRGRTVFQTDAPFDEVDGVSQIWDGNFNGTQVPEGVYYFVLKCDDSARNQSGSILLAR